jgi:hypothetical protein
MAEMFNPQNPEILELTRQRKIADLLTSQGLQTPQGQTVAGGIYVPPNPMEYIAKLYGTYQGIERNKELDTQEQALAQKLRQLGVTETKDILGIAQGKPEVSTELAGPAYRGVTPTAVMPAVAGNPQEAMAKALMAQSPQAQRLVDPLLKMALPELTPEQKRFNAAVADGSWNPQKQGGLNSFLNQMNDKDKASLILDKQRLGLENQRLAIAQQEFAFNTGIGMPTGSGQQVPMQTINPGSPILAPNQQMPQQMGMPNLSPKAMQDINIATAKEKNKLQVEAQAALPGALLTAQSGINTINELIGDTTVDKKGNIVFGKQQPKAGFSAAVGMPSFSSGLGIANLFPGSEAADFKAAFDQVSGQAFLGAIGTLKGSGAISEVEGAKATAALSRMKLSQSEAEFIKAANDFKEVLQKGYTAAQQRAGTAPMNPNLQTNVGGAKIPKFNPVTGNWE